MTHLELLITILAVIILALLYWNAGRPIKPPKEITLSEWRKRMKEQNIGTK